MSVPTELEIVAEFRRQFPLLRPTDAERAVLAYLHIARSHGVGYGWMRQALGIAWKLEDPIGYIDDERLIGLHVGEAHKKTADALAEYMLVESALVDAIGMLSFYADEKHWPRDTRSLGLDVTDGGKRARVTLDRIFERLIAFARIQKLKDPR